MNNKEILTQLLGFIQERAVFASGSPFPDYHTKDNRVLRPGQGNNSYIFPGLALGIMCAGIIDISEDFMLLAAEVWIHFHHPNIKPSCIVSFLL